MQAQHQTHFEGPEKKLVVEFAPRAHHDAEKRQSLTSLPQSVWEDLLLLAKCEILSRVDAADSTAYLLSESSLFVFAHRLVFKTCGQTTLLLTLPRILDLAAQLHCAVALVTYGHLRYKFPAEQVYPHRAFDEERTYLASLFGRVHERVLGPADGCCWYMLSAEPLVAADAEPAAAAAVAVAASATPPSDDAVLEVAMEGLAPEVRALFSRDDASVVGGGAAKDMTRASGLGALLGGARLDDWAFEPCGYSMNALSPSGAYYYTVHITPEEAFSYASFETNDPHFHDAALFGRIVGCFRPSRATATLTCAGGSYTFPALEMSNYDLPASAESCTLGSKQSIAYWSFCSSVCDDLVKEPPRLDMAAGDSDSDTSSNSKYSFEIM